MNDNNINAPEEIPTESEDSITDVTEETTDSEIKPDSQVPVPDYDGTSHVEISQMRNKKYSVEITTDAENIFNPTILKELKEKDSDEFLIESRNQIMGLWHCHESLIVHTVMHNVNILSNLGTILNMVEEKLKKKSEYMNWLKKNFSMKHLRYFQQAKQLAKMGKFAKDHASLGKNRLIEYDRLIHEINENKADNEKVSYENLLTKYPFEDTSEDFEGDSTKKQVDSIITLYRMKNAGIGVVDIEQATLLASFKGGALRVSDAETIKSWLDNYENKAESLEHYVMNKGKFPYGDEDQESGSSSEASIDMLMTGIINFSKKAELDNNEWIVGQKEIISEDILVDAYRFIKELAEKLEINLETHEQE